MKNIIFFVLIFLWAHSSSAQEERPYVNRSFVIIQSTKNYAEAKTTAQKAARTLNQKLDLRDLVPHKKNGLTNFKKDCEDNGWEYPCYVSRGGYDDGDYVSIEWSNAFTKFATGYYIVIVYSGEKKGSVSALQKAKKVFKDAYTKVAEVYIGCMH